MGLLRPRSIAAALARLDEDALAALAADLWAASGWETTVEGSRVLAERDGHRRQVRVVAGGGVLGRFRPASPDLSAPDVVVDATGSDRVAAAALAAGAEYVGPDALQERLRYAVPRERGRELARRHLGRPLSPTPDADGSLADRHLPALAVVLLVLGAVALTAGLPWPGGGPPGDVGTPAASGTPGVADVDVATPGTPTPAATATPYPPGLSAGGVHDVEALTDAHVGLTGDGPYAVTVRFDGPAAAPEFDNWTSVDWTLRVERRSRFLVDATYRRVGRNGTERADLGVYSGGGALYRRVETADATVYSSTPVQTRRTRAYRLFTASLIERYLDTSNTTVQPIHGEDRLRVVAAGTPERIDANVSGYRAEATVTPAGRVVALDVRYDLAGAERPVRAGIHYDEFGTATVDPPAWLDEARNATGG